MTEKKESEVEVHTGGKKDDLKRGEEQQPMGHEREIGRDIKQEVGIILLSK